MNKPVSMTRGLRSTFIIGGALAAAISQCDEPQATYYDPPLYLGQAPAEQTEQPGAQVGAKQQPSTVEEQLRQLARAKFFNNLAG